MRKLHKQTPKEIEKFLRNVARTSILSQGKIKIDQIKEDPSDNIYLSAAIERKADFIISGDHHLRDLKGFR
jgi:hypothetical protein